MNNIKMYDAAAISIDGWRQLQALQRDAFSSSLDRTQDEIDALVCWDDPAVYYASHINLDSRANTHFNPNQSFTNPNVAVATNDNELIGFAYSAHNVSGSTNRERFIKRLSIVKNYLWLREFAVRPDYHNQGIARQLGKSLLRDAMPLQPPVAYIWPDEIGFLQGQLESVGFVSTGEQEVHVFGEDKLPVRQVRMQASSVRKVLAQL